MKRNYMLFVAVAGLFFTQELYAQKTELHLNAFSGLFTFRGDGATSHSFIISYPFINPPTKYTLNPYGKIGGFSYALEMQGQRLTKNRGIYGLAIGFEALTSKVEIDKVGVSGDPAYLEYVASGETKLKNSAITLSPFIGHRFLCNKVSLDLLTGFDVVFCLNSEEKGYATLLNKDYITLENTRATPSFDFRPRIQLKAQLYKFGVLAGYSLGLVNYQSQSNLKAYTCFLRLGISYKVK